MLVFAIGLCCSLSYSDGTHGRLLELMFENKCYIPFKSAWYSVVKYEL